MATFYLIRHADKAVDGDVLSGTAPGVHLSEAGRRQAEHLAERLDGAPLHRILSSPLERARETAAPLARRKGLPVETSQAIGEFDFGAWTNRTIASLEPDAYWRQFNTFRSGLRAPGGDSMAAVQARFVGEMLRLHEAYPDDGIALVSHSDPIRAAVTYFAGVPLDLFLRFAIDPASVSIIVLGAYGPQIRCLNVTAGAS